MVLNQCYTWPNISLDLCLIVSKDKFLNERYCKKSDSIISKTQDRHRKQLWDNFLMEWLCELARIHWWSNESWESKSQSNKKELLLHWYYSNGNSSLHWRITSVCIRLSLKFWWCDTVRISDICYCIWCLNSLHDDFGHFSLLYCELGFEVNREKTKLVSSQLARFQFIPPDSDHFTCRSNLL